MDNSITNNFAKSGQAIADKAADKVQSGLHDVQHAAKETGASLSTKVDQLRIDAAPVFKKAAGRAQSMGKQGMDAVSDVVSQTSDSLRTYTKANPLKALMIAAASGALLLTLIKVLNPSRD